MPRPSAIVANADELTPLDQAIGDGDHGSNMARGLDAVLARSGRAGGAAAGRCAAEGRHDLVTTVGGASGPLYGSLLMGIGKGLAGNGPRALAGACRGRSMRVKKRGKSDVGAKTMLDVLVPVVEALRSRRRRSADGCAQRATDSREATKPMLATRGRASFLGERSIGHTIPGATSSLLILEPSATCSRGRA